MKTAKTFVYAVLVWGVICVVMEKTIQYRERLQRDDMARGIAMLNNKNLT